MALSPTQWQLIRWHWTSPDNNTAIVQLDEWLYTATDSACETAVDLLYEINMQGYRVYVLPSPPRDGRYDIEEFWLPNPVTIETTRQIQLDEAMEYHYGLSD